MYRIERIDKVSRFLELKSVWDDLLSIAEEDSVLLTHEWFRCWWDAYGIDAELLVLLVWKGSELIAIAPLARRRAKWRGLFVDQITFMANVQSNRTGLIVKGQHANILTSILQYLNDTKIHFDVLQLNYIKDSSITETNMCEMLAHSRLKWRRFLNNRSPYIPITGDWEHYRAGRSRNLRHKLNRLHNLYQRTGNSEVVKYERENVDTALREVFHVARHSWKHDQGSSLASREKEQNFFQMFARVAADKGWLNIWILRHKTEPIAFVYNLNYKDTIYSLKIGYDSRFSRFSPGEYLCTKAIADSFHNELTEYDWLGTNLPFKMKWTECFRLHHNYLIFNNTLRGKWLGLLELQIIARLSKIDVVRNFKQYLKKMKRSSKIRQGL